MDLKNQVTNLELSKKLKDLGFKQDSLFYWTDYIISGKHDNDIEYGRAAPSIYLTNLQYISAFTVAELGELLPIVIEAINPNTKRNNFYYLHFFTLAKKDGVYIEYSSSHTHRGKFKNWNNHNMQHCFIWQEDTTEANARAKMLIYLKTNKLI